MAVQKRVPTILNPSLERSFCLPSLFRARCLRLVEGVGPHVDHYEVGVGAAPQLRDHPVWCRRRRSHPSATHRVHCPGHRNHLQAGTTEIFFPSS